MSDDTITLNSLFQPDANFGDRVVAAGEQDLRESKDGVTRLLRALRWSAIAGELRRRAPELLNLDVMELVTGAWEKYNVLSELAEESRLHKETEFFPLVDHTIQTDAEPYIEVRIGTLPPQQIKLDVSAELVLKGLTLKIKDGKIVSIESGSCEGKGEIKYKQLSLLKRGFEPVQLPGHVNLGKGIPVGDGGSNRQLS